MSRWDKRFLFVAAVAIAVSMMAGLALRSWGKLNWSSPDASLPRHRFFPSPSPQPVTQRSWSSPVLTELWRFSSYDVGNKHLLFSGAFTIRTDALGTCFALDRGNGWIVRVSRRGQLLGTIGRGFGEGPGEFSNVTDFAPDGQGVLWVADGALYRVTAFDAATGSVLTSLRFDHRPHRVAVLENGDLVICFDRRAHAPLALCDRKGRVQRWFGRLFPEQLDSPFAAEGWLAVTRHQIFYSFLRVGLIAGFSARGKLTFLRKTLDDVPPPRVIKRVIGGQLAMWVDPASPIASLDMAVDPRQSQIYVLCGYPRKGQSRIVDVYDTSDGTYRYSFRLPAEASGLCVRDGLIWAACDTAIVHYRLMW